MKDYKFDLEEQGFYADKQLYKGSEVELITKIIENYAIGGNEVKKTDSIYSIRNLLSNIPLLGEKLFTTAFQKLISNLGSDYRVVKSIYFDKPPLSNWFVPNHQDLTINVKERIDIEALLIG